MNKFDFEDLVRIPEVDRRIAMRAALKARMDAAIPDCDDCDDTVLASADPDVHCHWSQSENALVCLTTWTRA